MYSLWDSCECTCGNDVPYVTVSVLGAWLVEVKEEDGGRGGERWRREGREGWRR